MGDVIQFRGRERKPRKVILPGGRVAYVRCGLPSFAFEPVVIAAPFAKASGGAEGAEETAPVPSADD